MTSGELKSNLVNYWFPIPDQSVYFAVSITTQHPRDCMLFTNNEYLELWLKIGAYPGIQEPTLGY